MYLLDPDMSTGAEGAYLSGVPKFIPGFWLSYVVSLPIFFVLFGFVLPIFFILCIVFIECGFSVNLFVS